MNALSQTAHRLSPSAHELAMRELCDDPAAVDLAKIVKVARPWVDARPVNFALFDCGALASDALDDLIFLAALSHDLDRDELPSTAEIVDMLGRG